MSNGKQPLVSVSASGTVNVDQDALKEHMEAESKKCAGRAKFALCVHVVLAVLVNIVVWGLWFALGSNEKGGKYPWPAWVSFGTVYLIVAHILSMVPFVACAGSKACPVWLYVIFLNFALVNIVAWFVWYISEKQACTAGDENCEYMWPLWVSGATAVGAVVISLAPTLFGHFFGIHDAGDEESGSGEDSS